MEQLELLRNLLWEIQYKPEREKIINYETDEPLSEKQWNSVVATQNLTIQCDIERYGDDVFPLQIQQGCTIGQLLMQIYDLYQMKTQSIVEGKLVQESYLEKMSARYFFEGFSQQDGNYSLCLES